MDIFYLLYGKAPLIECWSISMKCNRWTNIRPPRCGLVLNAAWSEGFTLFLKPHADRLENGTCCTYRRPAALQAYPYSCEYPSVARRAVDRFLLWDLMV